MLFGITGPEGCFLLCTYTPRSHQVSKIHLENQLYKFLLLSNGLCCGPRKFTKLMKPPIPLDGRHIIGIYIDDLINIGLTFDECVKNVIVSIKRLNSLEFIIHPDKSIYLPKQETTFLGFNINSKIKWKQPLLIKKETL